VKILKLVLMLMIIPVTISAAISIENYLDLEFPILGTGDSASIGSYMTDGNPLVIVVWDSDCPVCRLNVQEADDVDPGKLGVPIIGVNIDHSARDPLAVIENRKIGSPQLHDPDGLIPDALGIGGEGFSFALIAHDGAVIEIVYDNVPDARVAIEEAVARNRGSFAAGRIIPGGSPQFTPRDHRPQTALRGDTGVTPRVKKEIYPRLNISGNSRMRWQAVGIDDDFVPSSCSCPLGGSYGEPLRQMMDLHYRLTINIKGQVARGVAAGGLLRVSNEDPETLQSGPMYLTNDLGSAFVEIRRHEWSGRLGYYDIHFSPLTLQRWDFGDNPPSSGSGSSGSCSSCGGVSRSISLEALDDLGPEIIFEGARIAGSPLPWFDLLAAYARPRRESGFDWNRPESFAYRQDLFAVQATFTGRIQGVGQPALALNYVSTRDSKSSSPFWPETMAYDSMSFIHQNEVYSAHLETDLPLGFGLNGEYARSYQRADSIIARGEGLDDWATLVEFSHQTDHGTRLAAAWLRIGPDYLAAYSALSYQKNKVGMRASAACFRDRWGLSLFYKVLNRVEPRVDPLAGPDPERVKVSGGLLNFKPRPGLDLDLTATRAENKRVTTLGDRCDCTEKAVTLTVRQKIARGSSLTLQYLKSVVDGEQKTGDAKADIGSLYLSIDF
jgi:hypothetical protein